MMLSNGLASDDDAKAFKYASDAASNGLPYHMNVDSYNRTQGSRQPSPSEEDLTKNHSPGLPIAHSVPIKSGDSMGMPPNNPHSNMVGSLTGPIQAPGLSNGIGPMSGLVNGVGPPGKTLNFLIIFGIYNCICNQHGTYLKFHKRIVDLQAWGCLPVELLMDIATITNR